MLKEERNKISVSYFLDPRGQAGLVGQQSLAVTKNTEGVVSF